MAGLLENTSLSKDEILMLSIPEIEGILEGFRKNNSTDNTNDTNPLEGKEAVLALRDMGLV